MTTGKKNAKRDIREYDHKGQTRVNNPPVGLVTPDTDPDTGKKKTYAYDPHLDPQLVWTGKAERTSFEVPTVSLHVHERIDPLTVIEAVRKRNGHPASPQLPLFQTAQENPPLRDAVDFYRHKHNWSNRLIAGDSLLVMNSLLEKEGLAGHVQMVYIDPPYGITYGSNFQPFVNKRDVKDGKDEDLTQEPEMLRAFRDTWELGVHSYLTYLRDRLLLAQELLHESGSCFVQISDENVHRVRELMDEIYGTKNFVSVISYATTSGFLSDSLSRAGDYVVWYCKDKSRLKYRQLYKTKEAGYEKTGKYIYWDSSDGERHILTEEERENPALIPLDSKLYAIDNLTSQGSSENTSFSFQYDGITYHLPPNAHWKTTRDGLERLAKVKRLIPQGKALMYRRFLDDFKAYPINNLWTDTGSGASRADPKVYIVQTRRVVIERCMIMATDPGDLVLDPTCGSGTTAYVAEQWGRRWITCDTSRVAITLAKQRFMTAAFDYYELAHPEEGVGSGFKYKTVPHVTLKSIANNEPPKQETLYDHQPFVDRSKARVTGPFTVEAVPSPVVTPLSDVASPHGSQPADESIARSGETARQREWRDELLKTGIRGKGGQRIEFSRVEPLPGARHLHAEAETRGDKPERAVVCFGPEHAPLEQRQVALAIEEAQNLVPKPRLIIFAAFQFDPEAAKDIDETNWPGVALLKAQMNTDLLTDDLKKKRASNDSFWLMGQPDVELRRISSGAHKGKWQVEVRGFDYFDTRTSELISGGPGNIAIWLLDPDYDGRSIYPRQVFFPMADEKSGWARLARTLKAEIDEELIESYRGTASLPFELGKQQRVAVKIVDDRGIESLKIIEAK